MMKCTNCQSRLEESAKFCPYCGSAVAQMDSTNLGASQHDPSPSPPQLQPVSPPGKAGQLLLFSLLFAVIGGVLILVVAPELQGTYGNWLVGFVKYQTAESWAAMIGGGASLLISGFFLLRALVE